LAWFVRICTFTMFVGLAVSPRCPLPAAEVSELKATVRSWDVPTKGGKPYAVTVGPDGSVWFSEESANKIGQLDPKTGKCKEYPITEEKNVAPHGLAADSNGNVWFAASLGGFIGRLDPNSGKVTVYKMPDPKATDPESLAFDRKGILWFTVQNANMVGKLDPTSGMITLKPAPSANAHPTGIIVMQQGFPVFAEPGANKIGSIAPDSFLAHDFSLPPGTRSKKLAIAPDDNTLYFTDYVSGNLGKLDVSIGAMVLMPTPSGAESVPSGITISADGTVWYCETGVQPNNLIHFLPRTNAFARTPIPFVSSAVTSMAAAPDGRIYFVSSDVDKIGVVEVPK